jgi:hypothetical protein
MRACGRVYPLHRARRVVVVGGGEGVMLQHRQPLSVIIRGPIPLERLYCEEKVPKVELKKGRHVFIIPDLKAGLWFEN